MTFFYDSFSLHCKLKYEGFEPYVSEDEFILEIEDDDPRFIKFLECIKFAYNPNPGYDFLFNGLEQIGDNDVIKSLVIKVNEILDLNEDPENTSFELPL